jgi:hypothetical protein
MPIGEVNEKLEEIDTTLMIQQLEPSSVQFETLSKPQLVGDEQKISIRQETISATKEKSSKASTERKIEPLTVGSELNLEQNSIFAVSNYPGKSRETVIRKRLSTGEVIERKIIVGKTVDGIETGVLTTNHFKIYLALIKFWEEAGRPIDNPIRLTTLKILKEVGLSDTGPNYETVKRILRHLVQIPITFENCFFIPGNGSEQGRYGTLEDFHILSSLYIYERKRVGQKARGYGEFQFSNPILRNLINNYSHPLRLDVIREFKKHKDLSILLYTYIDRNIAFKDSYEIGLEKLFEHLDLSQRHVKYPSGRKRVLEPVLEQLIGKKLSTGILSHADIQKTVDGQDYKLVCRKKPFPKKLRDNPEQLTLPIGTELDELETPESPDPGSELFPLLIGNGLTEKQAAKLIAEKDPEVIRTQVEYLPYRVAEYKAQKKNINMPAILYDSISDNWNVPKGYIEAGKAKEREVKRLEAERLVLEEREEWDREEQERERIKAYKESLSPDDRAKLREKALEKIRSMEGVKEGFITENFIEAQENEILKEKD